jgi:hypothetical protein
MKLTLKPAFKASILATTLSIAAMSPTVSAQDFSLKGTQWETFATVDPNLLYAVAIAESQKYFAGGFIRPWPWAVNVDGKGHYFDTRSEAETFVDELIKSGKTNMDIGPLQVNTYWHGHRVGNPKDLFSLSTAVTVASNILQEAMNSSPKDPELGIGRYHTWSDESRAREYGKRVLKYWDAVLKAGGK